MRTQWIDDPDRTLKTGIHTDPATGQATLVHVEEVAPVLSANKRQFNECDHLSLMKQGFRHVARIPAGIVYKMKVEHGLDILNDDHMPKIMELLHDPDYKHLRTCPGDFRERPARTMFRASSAPAESAKRKIGMSKKLIVRSGKVGA